MNLKTNELLFFRFAAIMGLLSVVLGAFGAHALKSFLSESGSTQAWFTAVYFQLFHAIAIIGLLGLSNSFANRRMLIFALGVMSGGIILFSGSIYLLIISKLKIFGPITPLGGISLVIAWGSLCWMRFER